MGHPAVNFAKLGYGFDTNTKLLVHGDGANGGSTFVDCSTSGHGFTLTGTPVTSTAQSKFGGSSILLDGTEAIAVTGTLTDFAFGTGDFTIDAWIYTAVVTADGGLLRHVFGTDNLSTTNGACSLVIDTAAKMSMWYRSSGGVPTVGAQGATALTANTWTHVAVTRASNTVRIFINGTQDGSGTVTDSLVCGAPFIGAGTSVGGRWNGHIEEMHVIKGQALWTSSFTPPAIPYS